MAGEAIQSMVSVLAVGAKGDGNTDDTAAIQNAINQGFTTGAAVFFPAAVYRVSQLVLKKGTILQGVSSGTYPDNNTISGASVLARLANSNKDLLLAPDGANYCRLFDIAVDGNKNNNHAGHGLCVADGAAGQEAQIIVDRCYIHDNPDSNIYLGHNRRANNIHNSVLNYSLNGDGITVAGSDNTIATNIIGTNKRAGICLGTTATQNWGAASPSYAAAIAHVQNNDIYGNLVGVAVANGSSGCMVTGNGIDRHQYQGVTVYSGSSNALVTNTFHSNGTAKDNAYAHIDIGTGVAEVCVSNNNFGPLDAGITNVASHCVNVAAGAARITGHLGAVDPTAAHSVANPQAGAAPWAIVSSIGAVIQGCGNDVLNVRNSAGATTMKVTESGGVTVNSVAGTSAAARFVGGTISGAPTSGTWAAGDFAIDHTGKVWIYTGTAWVASHN